MVVEYLLPLHSSLNLSTAHCGLPRGLPLAEAPRVRGRARVRVRVRARVRVGVRVGVRGRGRGRGRVRGAAARGRASHHDVELHEHGSCVQPAAEQLLAPQRLDKLAPQLGVDGGKRGLERLERHRKALLALWQLLHLLHGVGPAPIPGTLGLLVPGDLLLAFDRVDNEPVLVGRLCLDAVVGGREEGPRVGRVRVLLLMG